MVRNTNTTHSMKEGRKLRNIAVDADVHTQLNSLKYELRTKNMSELIKKLIDFYNIYKKLISEYVVKDLLCNKYRESRASLQGWIKIISKELNSDSKDYVNILLEYVRLDGYDYVVDIDKCREPIFIKTSH